MAIIGYIRVSTDRQTTQHQRFEIKKFCRKNNFFVNRWVDETVSTRKSLCKRKLGLVLNELNPGDILLACEISRLGRSLLEVMHILEVCLNKNCQVWTIKENYRLGNDIQSKVMAFAFGLASELERQLISQRTKASLENIRACGRKLGRPLMAQSKKLKLDKNVKKVQGLLKQGVPKSKIAKDLSVNRSTLNRFIKRINHEE